MKLERLDHFGIEVRDLARAERFYVEVLGLSIVTRFGDQVLMDCGGQNLALFQVPTPPLSAAERAQLIAHPLGRGHHAFRVSREDFLSAPQRLGDAGGETPKPLDRGGPDCLY